MFNFCLSLGFYCVIKQHHQKQLEEESDYLGYNQNHSPSLKENKAGHVGGRSRQEPEAETDEKAIEEHYLLARSSLFAWSALLYSLEYLPKGSTEPHALVLPTSEKGPADSLTGSRAGSIFSMKVPLPSSSNMCRADKQ